MQGLGVLRGAVCLALVVTGEACAQRDPTDEERRWLRDEARRQSERAERDRRERLERFTLGDVQSAIDRGVAWLRERTTARARVYAGGPAPDGMPLDYPLGRLAMPVLALLRSGVPREALAGELELLTRIPFGKTYSVAAYAMVLDALAVERIPVALSAAAPDETRTQVRVARFAARELPDELRPELERAARWLIEAMRTNTGWGYDLHNGEGGYTDHSLTQFAVYALHGASTCGVDVPEWVWTRTLRRFLDSQARRGTIRPWRDVELHPRSPLAWLEREPEVRAAGTVEAGSTRTRAEAGVQTLTRPRRWERGLARGWSYGEIVGPSWAITGAGGSCLAMAQERLYAAHDAPFTAKGGLEVVAALRDAATWFAHQAEQDRADADARGDGPVERLRLRPHAGYSLWSLEKAMDQLGVEWIGDYHWWRAEVPGVLGLQRPDGSWGDEISTAFFLLFLNRSAVPLWPDDPAHARPAPATTERAGVETGVEADDFDLVVVDDARVSVRQSLAILADSSGRAARDALKRAKRALDALAEPSRPGVLPDLLELTRARTGSVRRWAKRCCEAIAGSDDPAEVERVYDAWVVARGSSPH